MTINLRRDEAVRLEGDTRGAVVACLEGVLWITQEGDGADHLLEAGDEFAIDRAGLVVIEARRAARLTVRGLSASAMPGLLPGKRRPYSFAWLGGGSL